MEKDTTPESVRANINVLKYLLSKYKENSDPQRKQKIANQITQIVISKKKKELMIEIQVNSLNNNLFLHILDCFSHRADRDKCNTFIERVQPFMLDFVELDDEYNQTDNEPFDLLFWKTYITLCSTNRYELSIEKRARSLKDMVFKTNLHYDDKNNILLHVDYIVDQIRQTQKKIKPKTWVEYFNEKLMERYWFQIFAPEVNNPRRY